MGDLFDPYAFAVGMVALLNPCGFALLPAWLGFFLGQQNDEAVHPIVALNRAQAVGLAMTLGFMTVFGLIGVVLAGAFATIKPALPYVSIAMGLAMLPLGIAMLRGYTPTLSIPKLNKGTGDRSIVSMFLFGVSYAVASLSCTMAVFLTAVGSSANGDGYIERLGGFLSYGLGMGLLATALTLAVATGRRGVVDAFRSALSKVNIISGLLLLVVGPYIVLYGIWDLRVFDPDTDLADLDGWWVDTIVSGALDAQSAMTTWVDNRTTVMGWSFLVLNAGLLAAGWVVRQQGRTVERAA